MTDKQDNIYNPNYVQRLFDKMSGSYERMNYITSFGFSIRWRKQFLDVFESTNQRLEVIDLLTGMGETWIATRRKFPNSNLTVLDFSEGMLKYARQKNIAKFDSKIKIMQQDILQNNLPDNHFDVATCAFGLKTFDSEQIRAMALETKRILKVGGRFSFVEVSEPNGLILKLLYGFYLGKVIPILGKLLLGNSQEYKMLWQYTYRFKNAKAASEIFTEVGLNTEFTSYFFGCATGFSGQKLS